MITALENKRSDVFYCSTETPVRELAQTAPARGTIVVLKRGEVQGVISDFASLVADHSYSSSPAPIGQLLINAVRAFLMVDEAKELLGNLRGTASPWVELRGGSRKTVGWLHSREV